MPQFNMDAFSNKRALQPLTLTTADAVKLGRGIVHAGRPNKKVHWRAQKRRELRIEDRYVQ